MTPHTNGVAEQLELDALIVGAGFGGVYQLWRLRNEGYKALLVESGSDYGGVWYWNRYPGARVDSTTPHYEFSDPALWGEWKWKQRFPGSEELRQYFSYVANKWDLRKDTRFETMITSATWDDAQKKWTVVSGAGAVFKARYFLLNTGFAAKRYIPDWEGITDFKGVWIHPSYWPKAGFDLRGKRVALIGTGSTGVQIAQDVSKQAAQLVVFQRTPNLALPMRQEEYTGENQTMPKSEYAHLFEHRKDSFSGFNFNFLPKGTFDDAAEERKAQYDELWKHGDFHFWLATYYDMLFSPDANREAYNYWRDKTRARINDERARDILAPMLQPHPFGCKRISLENGYFEIFDQDNVDIVDVNATPVQQVTKKGIKTSEKEWEFDYVISATGFDAITGGILSIDIKGKGGAALNDHWKNGTKTYLGISVSGFPNMFFTYGPQAPTAFCNGPTCAELQGEWIVNAMKQMDQAGKKEIVAQVSSEKEWAENIWKMANASLLPQAKSWYMGDNIPGKVREPLLYLGGVPNYYKALAEAAEANYSGFILA